MAQQSIALISAASALAGVVVTGTFALLKGRQERLDKQADRDEQRHVLHRAARRDVYAQLLTAYHEVDRQFGELYKTRPSTDANVRIPREQDIFAQVEVLIHTLREAAAAVALEGPTQASAAADDLCEASSLLLFACARIGVDHAGETDPLWSYSSSARDEARIALTRAHWKFIDCARAALGGDAPGFR